MTKIKSDPEREIQEMVDKWIEANRYREVGLPTYAESGNALVSVLAAYCSLRERAAEEAAIEQVATLADEWANPFQAFNGSVIRHLKGNGALARVVQQAVDSERERGDGNGPLTQEELLTEIRGAVGRGWCHDKNRLKEMDVDLGEAIAQEVFALIASRERQKAAEVLELAVQKCDLVAAKYFWDEPDTQKQSAMEKARNSIRALSSDPEWLDCVKAIARAEGRQWQMLRAKELQAELDLLKK